MNEAGGAPRRVIFVNRFFWPDLSATAQMLADLAFALPAQGWQVSVIASAMRYDEAATRLARHETARGVEVWRVPTTRFGRAGVAGRVLDYVSFLMGAAVLLARVARRGDIVVALTDPPLLGLPIGWIARLRGARVVNWLHDVYPEIALALVPGWAARAMASLVPARNRSLARAAGNVAIGEVMRDRLIAQGVAAGRIVTIANWADDTEIVPLPIDAGTGAGELRAAWGYGPSDFVIAYSGNFGRAHEAETILGAGIALRDRADVHFLFVGGGSGLAELRRRAAAAGLTRFRFQPYQPRADLARSLAVGDVHWVSLRPEMEGLIVPSKLYGIAAAGRATVAIADPAGEIGRLVSASPGAAACGIAIMPGDVAGLAQTLRELADDRACVATMGRAARAMIDGHLSFAHALGAWDELLRDVHNRR